MDFNTLGWSPEGQVYFSYAVDVNMNGYTVSASADIDADATYQAWGYKKQNAGADVAAMPTAGLTCVVGNLTSQVVGPCAATFGQSIF